MTNGTDFETVAEASKARIQELNPRVAFKLIPGQLNDKVFISNEAINNVKNRMLISSILTIW